MIITHRITDNGLKYTELENVKQGLIQRGVFFSDEGLQKVITTGNTIINKALAELEGTGYSNVLNKLISLEDFVIDVIGYSDMKKYFKSSWKVQKEFSMSGENFENYVADNLGTVEAKILDNVNKIKSTEYVLSCRNTWEKLKKASSTGWCTPEVKHAVTGRLLTSKPCLESISKDYRYDLLSLKEFGYNIYEIDFKEEEPRMLLSHLGIEELMNLPDEYASIYQHIANITYGITEFDSQYPKELFKQGWNGVSYGMTLPVATKLFGTYGLKGKEFYDYFYNHPEYLLWAAECSLKASSAITNQERCIEVRNILGNILKIVLYRGITENKLTKLIRSYQVQSAGVGVLEIALRGIQEIRKEFGVRDTDELDDGIFSYFTLHDAIYVAVDLERFGHCIKDIEQELSLQVQITGKNGKKWIPLVTKIKAF